MYGELPVGGRLAVKVCHVGIRFMKSGLSFRRALRPRSRRGFEGCRATVINCSAIEIASPPLDRTTPHIVRRGPTIVGFSSCYLE